MYYIDSGTSGVASPQYAAVAKAVALRNDKVDQVSASADQWGYVADGMKVKGTTDINDKYSTGLYQDTTRLVYRLPLDAGTYTLTGGFTEWWGLNRTMYQTVSVAGTELAKGSVPLSGIEHAPRRTAHLHADGIRHRGLRRDERGRRQREAGHLVARRGRPDPAGGAAERDRDRLRATRPSRSRGMPRPSPARDSPGYRVYEVGGTDAGVRDERHDAAP